MKENNNIIQKLKHISEILKSGDSLIIRNNTVGFISVDKGHIGKSGNGLQHIIEQRFEKDRKTIDEISSVLALVLIATQEGKVARNIEIFQNQKDIGTFDIEKNGIISFVSKTRDGKDEKFVITGFDDFSKKEEAADAIKAVIANYSYAPEFVIVKKQVVATLASSFILHLNDLKNNIEKQNWRKVKQEVEKIKFYTNSKEIEEYFQNDKKALREATDSINAVIAQYGYTPEFLEIYAQVGAVIASVDKITHSPEKSSVKGHPTGEKLEKSVYERTTVVVDGKRVVCEKGLLQGFKDEHRKMKQLEKENHELSREIESLRRNQSRSAVRNRDDGFEY